AGIRDTEDIVERIGVDRSREVLQDADLIILLLDGHESFTEEDQALFDATEGMETIVVLNKSDLARHISMDDVCQAAGKKPIIETSLLQDQVIDQLEGAIASLFFSGHVETDDATYVSNARHVALLKQAQSTIRDAKSAIENGMPVDMAQIDITRTWEILG